MNKKIYFLFNGRFPSEKADSLFAILDAKSFVDCGQRLIMVVPSRIAKQEDPFDFYGIEKKFEVIYIPIIDGFFLHLPKTFAFWFTNFIFSISAFFYLIKNMSKDDIVYSNELLPLFLVSFFKKTFYEMHDYPKSKLSIFGIMLKRISYVLIHNKWKTDRAIRDFNLNKDKIITLANAVDLDQFSITIDRNRLRQQLKIPTDAKVVVYSGHLYSWKGADLLADIAKDLSQFEFYFIGGNQKDLIIFKEKYRSSNIHFIGFKPHKEIPLWQKVSDCLVLPNTGKEDISKYYTSPMKLFEYMASDSPIVASNIPSISEIVSDKEVRFFEPDNGESLKEAINFVLSNREYSKNLVENAKEKVKQYTWEIRAKKILNFIYDK